MSSLLQVRFRRSPYSAILSVGIFLPMIFFLLSNFGVWASTGAYPVNFGGLISCYAAGLPFLLNQTLGDLFYSLSLFAVALYVFHLKAGKVRVVNNQ